MFMLAGLFGLLAAGVAVEFSGILKPPESDDDGSADFTGGEGVPPHASENTIEGTPLADIILGTGGADDIHGDDGDDQIGGYDGDDLVDGGAGRDDLHGQAGDDTLSGDAGDDTLHGEDGNDSLMGGAGDDMLSGHEGDDRLEGGDGDDRLIGGGGSDSLCGGAAKDALQGALGDDILVGGLGQDTLMGGDGNDILDGRVPAGGDEDHDERDFLNGGDGDDTILAGQDDWAEGGAGADAFLVADWAGTPAAPTVIADYNPAEDRLALLYDPEIHPDPEVTVESDPAVDGAVRILIDGSVVAQVLGAADLEAADVRLIAERWGCV